MPKKELVAVTPVDIEKDIEEYKALERIVIEDFLNGLIKLGALLKTHRDKHKPLRTYTEYLEGIGRSVSATNQLIRIYEYSIKHLSELLESNLTNWGKVNMFLSLPEPLRAKLAKEIGGKEVSTDEFREAISEVKEEEPVEIEDSTSVESLGVDKMISGASLADVPFMAKKILDELTAKGITGLTESSIPIVSVFLYMEKALHELKESMTRNPSEEESAFWKKILESEIAKLTIATNGL